MWIWWWQNICHTCHMTPERCLLEVGRRVQGGRQMGDEGGDRWEQMIKPISCTLLKEWTRRSKAGRLGWWSTPVTSESGRLALEDLDIEASMRYWVRPRPQIKIKPRQRWEGDGSEDPGSISQHPPDHSQLQSQGNQCPLLVSLVARHSHDA